MTAMRRLLFTLFMLTALWMPWGVGAQNTAADLFPAEVIGVIDQSNSEEIEGTDVRTFVQTLDAVIQSGPRKGERITVFNNYVPVEIGDQFIAAQSHDPQGGPDYFLQDIDRRGPVVGIAVVFAVVVIALAGLTGARSLFSLGVSFAAIFLILVPLLLNGWPPVPTTVLVASIVLAAVMYITHGVKATTHAAFLGTVITVAVAGILADIAVAAARLSGYAADEAVFLNASTNGAIDLAGLLLGAIIIGALGLLDDIAITQAATVAELKHAASHLTSKELYFRAMRVGREHIGALVNTLALAYAGVSLPLLMLASRLDTPMWMLINQEIFATEIVRTAIGGIALVLAVPLTTLIAIRFAPGEHTGLHTHSHARD